MVKLNPIQYSLDKHPVSYFQRWISSSKPILPDLKMGCSFFL
jgi:hypothetical protein